MDDGDRCTTLCIHLMLQLTWSHLKWLCLEAAPTPSYKALNKLLVYSSVKLSFLHYKVGFYFYYKVGILRLTVKTV